MFICGNNAAAKEQVSKILDLFGWEIGTWAMRRRRAQSSRCACCGAFRHDPWTLDPRIQAASQVAAAFAKTVALLALTDAVGG